MRKINTDSAESSDSNGVDAGSIKVKDVITGQNAEVGKEINKNEDGLPDKTDQRMQFARDILEKMRKINTYSAESSDSNGLDAGSIKVKDVITGQNVEVGKEINKNEDGLPDKTDQRMQFARDILEKMRKINTDSAESSDSNGLDAGSIKVKDVITGQNVEVGKEINKNEDGLPDKTDKRMQFARDILKKMRKINTDSAESSDSNGVDAGSIKVKDAITGQNVEVGKEINKNEDGLPDKTDQRMQFARDILKKMRKINTDSAESSDSNCVDAGSIKVKDVITGQNAEVGKEINKNEDGLPDKTDQRMQFARDILEKMRKINAESARLSSDVDEESIEVKDNNKVKSGFRQIWSSFVSSFHSGLGINQ